MCILLWNVGSDRLEVVDGGSQCVKIALYRRGDGYCYFGGEYKEEEGTRKINDKQKIDIFIDDPVN